MSKKLLAVLLAMCMAVSLLPSAALADSTDHWAAGSIERWTQEGVLDGSAINPDAQMTRAEFAQMLCNLMGYTQTSDTVFTDLPEDDPAAEAISKLVKAGVMNGVGDGKVDPNGTLTREQAAVMLCRALDIKPSDSAMSDFKDSANVSSWAAGAMAALTERGMMNGVGDGLLAPGGLVSNGTAAALVDKMVGEYVTEDRTITGEVKGIVLVVKGAKAEIKDATLSDPVVVKDAAAALTNTKADDVVANGGTVTTDAATTVANVTLTGETPKATIEGKVEGDVTAAGTKPQVEVKGDIAGSVAVGGSDAKVDLKGEVAGGVTVTEDATGKPAVTAPKGTEVKNESSTDASVNGGTVASGDNTTTTTNPPSTSGGGSSSTGGGGTTTPPETDPDTPKDPEITKPDTGDASTDNRDDTTVEDNPGAAEQPDTPEAGEVDADSEPTEGKTLCGAEGNTDHPTHTWGEPAVTAATCTEDGQAVYTCENCGVTSTQVITKLGHNYYVSEVTKATCTVAGSKTETCANCGDKKTTEIAAKGHDFETSTRYGTDNDQHWKICKYCDATDTKANHTWVKVDAESTEATCLVKGKTVSECACGAKKTEEVAKKEHAAAADAEWQKDNTKHWHVCATEGCNEKVDEAAHVWTKKTGKCDVCEMACPNTANHANILTTATCPTCGANGTKEPEATTKYSITLAADSEKNIKFQNENGTDITQAAEGEKVYIVYTPITGVVSRWIYKYQGTYGPMTLTPQIENDGTGKAKKYITMPAADVTVSLTYEYFISVNPTTDPDVDSIGKVNVENGSVDVAVGSVTFEGEQKRSAAAGKTVTLTVTPNTGYQLKTSTFKVNDGTSDITVTTGENNTYTFTMPAKNVTVTVEFEATTPSGGGENATGNP